MRASRLAGADQTVKDLRAWRPRRARMLPPFVGLKGNNQPGAALQDSSEQACPYGELDRDGAAIGTCRCAASDGRTLSTPSSA
jgi:hypothetical protein